MKRSAGILIYRKKEQKYQIFLAHMGGPFWQNINVGAWSIPKGEINQDEKIIDCARREFQEETGISIQPPITYLASKKVSNHKLVIIFTKEQDVDNSNFQSNFFSREFPKGSGIIRQFPEMDKAEWFDIDEAKKIINPKQLFFINRLERYLKKTN